MSIEQGYETIAHEGENIKKKAANLIRNNFAYIILILNIALSVVFRLFSTSLENPFNMEFFISLFTNILTSMFSYCIFIPYGNSKEKLILSDFQKNKEIWITLSDKVRKGLNSLFLEYCKKRVDIEREERRRAIIENNTIIGYNDFVKTYLNMPTKDIHKLVKEKSLDASDARYILKAKKQMKVKPINPLLILSGIKISSLNEVGRDGVSPSTIAVISKPISMFILNALTTMIRGSWIGISTGEEVVSMILSVLMIIISSLMGFSSGVSAARKENSRIVCRIFFIENFIKEIECKNSGN